jgi:hypothetical protein
MMKGNDRSRKYLLVWDRILDWIEIRLSQKEELTTAEVKHLAEIQEKIQKSQDLLVCVEAEENKSSLEKLVDVIIKSRKKYR